MSEVLFRVVSDVKVVPAARTRRGSQTAAAIAYRQNQRDLAEIFGSWGLILGMKPHKMTFPIPVPCIISYTVGYKNRRWRDDDNVRKALTDALKKGGIITEDNANVVPGADRTRTRLGAGRDYLVLELREDMGRDLE